MRLKNQAALVTGAASGFGAVIARQYTAQGAKVAVAAGLGDNAIAVTCDVDPARRHRRPGQGHGGPLWPGRHRVVNNAGWTHKNQPLMRQKHKGVMLHIGSTAGIRPRPALTGYNSAKGAVNLMSKLLAVELAPDNIHVHAIGPVLGATGRLAAFMGMPDTPEKRQKFIATVPLGRLSTLACIARAALCRAIDGAEFITGIGFPVVGGRTV